MQRAGGISRRLFFYGNETIGRLGQMIAEAFGSRWTGDRAQEWTPAKLTKHRADFHGESLATLVQEIDDGEEQIGLAMGTGETQTNG